jgi:hypothetical protein
MPATATLSPPGHGQPTIQNRAAQKPEHPQLPTLPMSAGGEPGPVAAAMTWHLAVRRT